MTVPTPGRSLPVPSRRILLLGAGIGGVLVGLALLLTVFSGPDTVQLATPPPPPPAARPQAERQEPAPSLADEPVVPELSAPVVIDRDPFAQLVTVPDASLAGAAIPPVGAGPAGTAPPAAEVTPASAPTPLPEPDPAPSDVVSASPPSPELAVPAPELPPSPVEMAPLPPRDPPPPSLSELVQLNFLFTDAKGRSRAVVTFEGQLFAPISGEVVSERFVVELIDRVSGCLEVSDPTERVRICLPSWLTHPGLPTSLLTPR